jgi:hypothetical protein
MPEIIKCSSKHDYQYSVYGYGNRIANSTPSGQLRCTVCGTTHGTASITKAKAKPVITEASAPVVKAKPAEKPDEKKDDKKKSLKGGKR